MTPSIRKSILDCVSMFAMVMILEAGTAVAAPSDVNFTIATTEAVNVDTGGGTPQIAVDVGGVTRYATYSAGTGTSSLTFSYTPVIGDVDLDGIALTSPIDLNGGAIADLNGNPMTDLSFVLPNTSGIKINYPSLSMDFIYDADGRYTLNGTAYNDLTSFLGAAGGTFSRASTATYFDSTGTLQTAATNQPRFNYDPVTHAAKGILIEEQRTNLLRPSEEFDHADWTKNNITVSANSVMAPDGTMTADTLSNMGGYVQQVRLIDAGQTYTVSVFLKGTGTVNLRLQRSDATERILETANLDTLTISNAQIINATRVSSSIESVGGGWVRISITGALDTTTSAGLYVSTFTGDLSIWGAQLEEGTFVTSYIPTTSAAVTRTVDSLYMPTLSWFDVTAGQIYATINPVVATYPHYPQICLFGDGTGSNFIAYTLFPNNFIKMEWKQSGSTLYTIGSSTAPANTDTKIVGAYQSSSSAIVVDGAAPSTSAVALGVLPITTFSIGSNLARGGSDGRFTGTLSSLRYYPTRSTNAQLQLLTQ